MPQAQAADCSESHHIESHVHAGRGHHCIGGGEDGYSCMGCHAEMQRIKAAQRVVKVARDQVCRF
jgi:hypothetical protein